MTREEMREKFNDWVGELPSEPGSFENIKRTESGEGKNKIVRFIPIVSYQLSAF
jgi:hypothetical protein